MITLLGKRELVVLPFCGFCTFCHGLFALPVGVIDRLCSLIVAIPRHLLFVCFLFCFCFVCVFFFVVFFLFVCFFLFFFLYAPTPTSVLFFSTDSPKVVRLL